MTWKMQTWEMLPKKFETYDMENVDIEMLPKKFETCDMTNPKFLFCRPGCERDRKAALLH